MIDICRLGKFPIEVGGYFPFTPRSGQVLMANEIYYGVLGNNHIAIEGAAGLGKTITCLCSLLPICKREGLMLLYASRTHSQMRRVVEELNAIQRKTGEQIIAICLHGRSNMCLNPLVRNARSVEAMDLCRILRKRHECSWYDNIEKLEIESITGCFHPEDLLEYGKNYKVCPYFLGKRVIPYCDVVILTYTYLINPFIRPLFLRDLQKPLEDCILVLDECHNLPEMSMRAMSVNVSARGLGRTINELDFYNIGEGVNIIREILNLFRDYLEELNASYGDIDGEVEVNIEKGVLIDRLRTFAEKFHEDLYMLSQNIQKLGYKIRLKKLEQNLNPHSSIYHFGTFLERFISTLNDPQYLHYAVISLGHAAYHIRCIDCRIILEPLTAARSIISMSGTLEPIEAYLEICGFPLTTRRQVLPSPFDHRNVCALCLKGVNLSFHNRNSMLYDLLSNRCVEAIEQTIGNTAIFCPSYDVLEPFRQKFQHHAQNRRWRFYAERNDGTSKENEIMISQFKRDGHEGRKAVLIGVCGGRNSEGVDFPGVEMSTVIILGIPLARPSHSTNALIKYYTKSFGIWKGKEYAYVLPALRRANQAAGRPVRKSDDQGVIILTDERFGYPFYRRFLSHWINESLTFIENRDGLLGAEVARFFKLQRSSPNDTRRK